MRITNLAPIVLMLMAKSMFITRVILLDIQINELPLIIPLEYKVGVNPVGVEDHQEMEFYVVSYEDQVIFSTP